MSVADATPRTVRTRRGFGLAAIATLTMLLTALIIPSASAATDDFKDVPKNHKFRTEITWLADQQITTGYANGTFKPRDSVSREAFAAFLYRLAGKPPVNLPSKSPFKDVKKSAQFYKEIVWLSQQGITNGWSDGTFRPKDKISREAVAAFLYRFDGAPSFTPPSKSPFKDVKKSSQFYKEITWLSQTGMTGGYADNTFRPKNNVSREAIAAFLHRGNTVAQKDGTYKVGSGIKPGIYSATPAGKRSSSPWCEWELRSSTGRTLEGGYSDGGRLIVELSSSDSHFYTSGCSGWTPIRKISPSATTFGDGASAVGYHMRTGTYQTAGGKQCNWWHSHDFTPGNYIEINTSGKSAQVKLTAGQGILTSGCGTWKRVGN